MHARWCLSGAALASQIACAAGDFDGNPSVMDDARNGEPASPSWEEFKARSSRTAEDGTVFYVVEGDIPITDQVALRAEYQQQVAGDSEKSLVRVTGGQDAAWDGEELDLTYCVQATWPASTPGFLLREGFSETGAERRALAIEQMAQATRAWSAQANIYFRYVPSEDANCAPGNNSVLVNVVFFNSGGPGADPAAASFPDGASYPGYNDSLAINYDIVSPADRLPIFLHEVGHVLGLMHEQLGAGDADGNGNVDSANSNNSAGCNASSNWRRLAGTTTYDVNSIMGYSTCGMTPGTTLSFYDGLGVRELYGSPAAWFSAYGMMLL